MNNYYTIIRGAEDYIVFLTSLADKGIDITSIDTPPSEPCLLEVWDRGGEITHTYTEVWQLEKPTAEHYIDEDPEFVILMEIAREMMFTNSKIQDSTQGE